MKELRSECLRHSGYQPGRYAAGAIGYRSRVPLRFTCLPDSPPRLLLHGACKGASKGRGDRPVAERGGDRVEASR